MRIPTVTSLWLPLTLLSFAAGAGATASPQDKAVPTQNELSSIYASLLAPTASDGVQGRETSECRTCHEEDLYRFNGTYHASVEESCYACHQGDTADEHMRGQLDGEDVPGPSFENLDAEATNAVCLSCHESSHHPSWEGSAHARRGLSCTECHSVHSFQSEREQLKTAEAAETCSACHKGIRAQMLRTSHHPVREGLIGCESCHNPHDGSTPKMINADWVNELCLQCHQEKRGPFLWEHGPVRENCLNCHNPHGSNHDKLLVAKLPYLCQRCHLNTRHPGTFYDGSNAGNPIATASNRAIEHACKNCHQNVHGGNAPSGPYLGR